MPEPIANSTVLYGGKSVTVVLRNGDPSVVHLRLIKISEIGKYLDDCLEDHAALLMCIDTPTGFDPDSLNDDSYEKLVEECRALNFTRALRLKEAEILRAETSGAGIRGLLQSMASILRKYAPPSPSPEDLPASKSGT